MTLSLPFLNRAPRVAVIRLHGAIAAGPRGQVNDAAFAPLIERAFKRGKPAAVALSVNSPGGSPVQSSMIAERIRRLATEKEIPVYAFVEDVAASGGYWLACAADRIYADKTSIVGSIPGAISLIWRIAGTRQRTAGPVTEPTRTSPTRPARILPISVSRLSSSVSMARECFRKALPAWVGSIPLAWRRKRGVPASASISFRMREAAGCDIARAVAAI